MLQDQLRHTSLSKTSGCASTTSSTFSFQQLEIWGLGKLILIRNKYLHQIPNTLLRLSHEDYCITKEIWKERAVESTWQFMRVTSFLCIGRDKAELTDGFNCRANSSTHLVERGLQEGSLMKIGST